MEFNRIEMDNWNDSLLEGMLHFINYVMSEGPLDKYVTEAEGAVRFAEQHLQRSEAASYRQELGGFFTSAEQLIAIPDVEQETLEQLAFMVNDLDLAKLAALAPQTTQHNRVEAYVNGPACLQIILDEVNAAERYIHLSVMLFFNDKSGNRIAQALLSALSRGIIVRVMVDYEITSIGYENNVEFGDFQSIADQLTKAGGKLLNTFHSCYKDSDWEQRRTVLASRGVSESSLFLQDCIQQQAITGLDIMNHRKFIVIDGVTSILGSINIGDQYLYDTPIQAAEIIELDGTQLGIPSKSEEWHDGCFRIKGAAAKSMNNIFYHQWTALCGDLFDPNDSFYYPDVDRHFGYEECTLLSSFPGNPINLIQQYHLSLISYVSDETIIINPYFIDQDFWELLNSLSCEQAKHITICNSLRVNDHPTNEAAVRSNMYDPFMMGVSFYDYSETERFSHWKISYDKRSDCVFHGSYNMNERSARHDFELGLLVKSKDFATKVKKMIDYDLFVSRQITDSKEFYQYPALHPGTYLNKITAYFA
ncbi:cardiolipin synthase [Paenibacillus castaneae]|uniref:phospholipase D-like domain-containing protein n=1 Tax=Paenibacillus castaneae TaxID=474957 RepID=UPI000C9B14C3|nr:phospholipase D-like domain-containing protein [Paenibacillus castaneae]NIK79656.1 cardiolipin synthase [Paenibacillus castaneae]